MALKMRIGALVGLEETLGTGAAMADARSDPGGYPTGGSKPPARRRKGQASTRIAKAAECPGESQVHRDGLTCIRNCRGGCSCEHGYCVHGQDGLARATPGCGGRPGSRGWLGASDRPCWRRSGPFRCIDARAGTGDRAHRWRRAACLGDRLLGGTQDARGTGEHRRRLGLPDIQHHHLWRPGLGECHARGKLAAGAGRRRLARRARGGGAHRVDRATSGGGIAMSCAAPCRCEVRVPSRTGAVRHRPDSRAAMRSRGRESAERASARHLLLD